MWPTKKGLGPQLTWGVHGANLHLEQLDEEKPWLFARCREGGLEINKIHNSTQRIVPPQLANLELSDTKSSLYNGVIRNIPEKLTSELQQQDKMVNSQLIYDPKSIGKILDSGQLKRKNGVVGSEVVAYVSSSSQSQLVVQHLEVKNEAIVKYPEEIESDEIETDKREVVELKVPVFGSGASIDLQFSIKQVEISKSNSAFKIPQEIILVRTLTAIFVVKVEISSGKKKKLKLTVIQKIDSSDLFQNDFAHVTNDPYDNLRFAIVDTLGNWAVLRTSKTRNTVDLIYRGAVSDFDDFSSFRRLSWGSNDDELLLIGRTYLKKVKLSTGETTDLIIAKQWSRIREYKMSDADDNHGFLLTSRELIWVDTSQGFKRMLSWKHYLEPEDPSLAMQVQTIDGVHYIMLHTQSTPLLIIFQFRMDDGFPKSIHDPIIIKTDSNGVAQSYILLPIRNQILSLFKITTQLEIKSSILAPFKGGVLKYFGSREKKQTSKNTYGDIYGYKLDVKVVGENALKRFNKNLFGVSKEDSRDIDDAAVLQEYASRFQIDQNDSNKPLSMFDFTEPIEKFNGFEEFDNMFEQLSDHFKTNNLEFLPLKRLSKHVIEGSVETFEDLYDNLFKSWRSSIMAKKAAVDIGLSLSISYDPVQEEKDLSLKVDQLPTNLRNIVDDWEKDYENEEGEFEENNRMSQVERELFSQPTQPIIQITQSQQSIAPSSQSENLLLRQSSQKKRSSQKGTYSQRINPSQSTQKRKKKKIKGFA